MLETGGPGGIIPGMQHLLDQGFPGQSAIGDAISPAMAAASGLLDTGGGGGLIPGLHHLMNQGLPGKQQMEGLIPSQFGLGGEQQALGLAGLNAPFTSAPQTAAEQAITSGIAGGGISPEYEQAARQRILEPAQRALRGRLGGEILGGQGSMRSGLAQELLRRQEQDFLSDLAMQGQQNLLAQQQLGLGAGQQRFAQQLGQAEAQLGAGERALGMGMGAFGAYPEATLPMMQLAGGLQGQLANQGLQQYTGLGGQGLQALQTAANIQQSLGDQALNRFDVMGQRGMDAMRGFGEMGQIPFQQAATQQALMNQLLPAALGREEFTGDFAQQNIGNALSFMDAMNRNAIARQQIPANLIQNLLGQQMQAQAVPGILGALLGSGIQAAPGILKEARGMDWGWLRDLLGGIRDVVGGDGEEETPTTGGGKIPHDPRRLPLLPTGGGGPMTTPPFNPGARGPL